jgi:hypothetical protein
MVDVAEGIQNPRLNKNMKNLEYCAEECEV